MPVQHMLPLPIWRNELARLPRPQRMLAIHAQHLAESRGVTTPAILDPATIGSMRGDLADRHAPGRPIGNIYTETRAPALEHAVNVIVVIEVLGDRVAHRLVRPEGFIAHAPSNRLNGDA